MIRHHDLPLLALKGRSQRQECPTPRKARVRPDRAGPGHMRPGSYAHIHLQAEQCPPNTPYRDDVFGRLWAWSRRHGRLMDALRVAPFAALCLLLVAPYAENGPKAGAPGPGR